MSLTPADERRLLSTTDALVWTDEFRKIRPDVDSALMHTWFAAAIETGRDAGVRWATGQRALGEGAKIARTLEGR